MELSRLFSAKKEITIIGILPIESEITGHTKEIVNLYYYNPDFKLSIFHESENDLFVRSLYLDSKSSNKRISFQELKNKIARIRRLHKSFLSKEEARIETQIISDENLKIKQLNLKQPLNVIKIDDEIYTSEIFLDIAIIQDYQLESDKDKIDALNKYIDFISDEKQGGIYQSIDGEELIEMYDTADIPQGIFPRKAFYNTNFQRYSVWIFVFNRNGQLMLHQRNDKLAKDNAGLWDKSAGGHVNITDRSSNEAAEREIIEEMYLPEAEYTKYLSEDTTSLINLGEWRAKEREYEQGLNLFKRIGENDWGYFYLKPSVKRVSKRRFVEAKNDKEKIEFIFATTYNDNFTYLRKEENPAYKFYYRDTKFISDIFFFIAPETEINNEEELIKVQSKAAKCRTLIEIRDLLDWIDTEKENGNAEDIFTDDLLFIATQYKETLLGFADHIKQIFKNK
jgi:isopentenyldiphosphate isomerase